MDKIYKVILLKQEEILSINELENYNKTFVYIETLIKHLGENKRIIVHEKRNDKWEKFGEWKLKQ